MNLPAAIREKANLMTDQELADYIKKVNNLLENMKPTQRITIKKIVKENTKDLFIEIVKYYMRTHDWQGGLCFSSTFEDIIKYDYEFLLVACNEQDN